MSSPFELTQTIDARNNLTKKRLGTIRTPGCLMTQGSIGGPVCWPRDASDSRSPKFCYDHRWGTNTARAMHGSDVAQVEIDMNGGQDTRRKRITMDSAMIQKYRDMLVEEAQSQVFAEDEKNGCEVTRLGFTYETARGTTSLPPIIQHPFARYPSRRATSISHYNIANTVGSKRLGAPAPILASPNNQFYRTSLTNLNFSRARGFNVTL
eukprot:m.44059 g.44059  ORF g.44059 m.44059 type:complete len:209 (-) comp19562_c0_seq1:81-707(-)